MARLPRIVLPNHPHHVTQRGVRSMDIFHSDEDRVEYLTFLKESAEKKGLKFLSYCLMNNHVHFIVIPSEPDSLAKGIGEAHRLYTRYKNSKAGVRGHLFQDRFFSCTLSESHFYSAIRYVERNPVKASIVKNAWDYEWSSAKFFTGERSKDKLVDKHPFTAEITDWKNFLSIDGQDDLLISSTKTGRPCGDECFVDMLELELGRKIKKNKPGPKRGN